MKKWTGFLCVVLLLVWCVGCASDAVISHYSEPVTEESSVAESSETVINQELEASVISTVISESSVVYESVVSKATASYKPSTSKPSTKKLVTDAIYKTLKDPYDGHVYKYHIPQVNLSKGLADEVNQKMRSDGLAWLKQAEQTQKDGVSIINGDYTYSWSHYEEVVSVLAIGEYPDDSAEYYVYNVSETVGKQLSNNDLRQLYGLSQQQLTDLLVKKAGDCFQSKYKGVNADPFYTEQYNKTVATSNANQAILFINQSGKLCGVTKIYSLAGADYYYHMLTLS